MNLNQTPVTLLAADFLARQGISVLRMKPNRDKRPDGDWKIYQSTRLTPEEVQERFSDGAPLGVVTGQISGNLVMAEVEGRAQGKIVGLRDLAHDSGLGSLWDKVDQGWKEISPSGGVHWFFRQESPPAGNKKLARRPATEAELEENPDEKVKVLAETRGEGGFVVVAPTPGHFHKTGNPWRMGRNCSPARVPTLTDDEAEAFLGILSTLDEPIPGREQHGPRPASPFRKQSGPHRWGEVTPGDDYERVPWEEILVPHGWRLAFEDRSGVKYWTRPGKKMGVSASTGRDPERDRLYVFTTSTSFDSEVPYTKFGAYAHLNHGDDYKAAASQLRKDGFGRGPEIVASTPPRMETPPAEESHTRQDSDSPGINPGRTETSNAAPALAPVVDIQSKRKPAPAGISAFTEEGNAVLFVHEHGSILRYNPTNNRWVVWENTRWVPQEDSKGGHAINLARQTVQGLPTGNEFDRKWRNKSQTLSMYRNMLGIASSTPELIAKTTDFDNRPWELNTPSGHIDLHTGKLNKPDPKHMHSKSTIVTPDFDADRTPWLTFLNDTFPHNQPMIDYLQRLAGMTLVGQVREHILIFGHGKGGNGKGVTIEVMGTLLGDYAISTASDFLMKQPFKEHPEEIAALVGARMVINSEIDPRARFDEARANVLSGGDQLRGRLMRENSFYFQPSHQMWITGNHLPKVEGSGGEGFWRRMRIIPFNHTVPDDRVDPDLKHRLITEHGPAILAWMIEGAVQYSKHGLAEVEPVAVTAATQRYREQADTLAMFLEEECIITPEEERDTTLPTQAIPHIPVSMFYDRYVRYCRDNKESELGRRVVAAQLREHHNLASSPDRRPNGRHAYLWVELNDKTLHQPVLPPGSDYSPGAKVD